MKRVLVLTLLAAAGAPRQALADAALSGVVRAHAYHASALPGTPDFYGLTLHLKAEPRLSSDDAAKVEVRATNVPVTSMTQNAPSDTELVEAWAVHHFANADLRIGKQIVVWGRADGINPTDNLNGRDLLTWRPFDDDQRIGAWALKVDGFVDQDRSWTLFVAPELARSRAKTPPVANPVIDRAPERSGANTQLGLKWNQLGNGLDYSISYYRGFASVAELVQVGVNARGPLLEQHYDPVHVLGADFAASLGKWGVRAEAAYTIVRDSAVQRKSNLYWVAGVDRTIAGNLNVNVQLFGRAVRDFEDPLAVLDPKARYLAVQNAISISQQDRRSYGYTLRVSDKWLGETVDGDVLLVRNTTRNNSMVRAVLGYALTDQWKVLGGAVWYRGAAETLFGRRVADRRLLVEVKYAF
jgi:hypothetical protein